MNTKLLRSLTILPLAVLVAAPLSAQTAQANEVAARADATAAEIQGDAAKAALKELDAEIDRVDAAVDNAPTPEDKAAAKARLKVLKDRRSELRKNYASARYDELKADVRAEANRVGAWAKRTFTKDPADKAMDDAKDSVASTKDAAKRAGDNAYATAASAGASIDLAAYKLRPTDTNKDEAKAALKALDNKIDALEDRADDMPKGAARDAAKAQAKALEKRKDALEKDFNKARFNALIDDVQSAWDKI